MLAFHATVPSVALSEAVPLAAPQYSPRRVPTVGVSACVPSEMTPVPVRTIGDHRRLGEASRSTSTSPPTGIWTVLPASAPVRVASGVGYGKVSARQSRGVGVVAAPLPYDDAPQPLVASASATAPAATSPLRSIRLRVRQAAESGGATRPPAIRS